MFNAGDGDRDGSFPMMITILFICWMLGVSGMGENGKWNSRQFWRFITIAKGNKAICGLKHDENILYKL